MTEIESATETKDNFEDLEDQPLGDNVSSPLNAIIEAAMESE